MNFACGTLPTYASCSFSPAVLTFSGTATVQTTTLTFTTKSTRTALVWRESFGASARNVLAASFFLSLGVLGLAYRRRKLNLKALGLFAFLLVSFGAAGLSGCAGSQTPTTAAGTYTVPVTATVNGSTTALNLNITVQ